MLYLAYQFQDDVMAPIRKAARQGKTASEVAFWLGEALKRQLVAGLELLSRFELTHERPDFAIAPVRVGNRDVPVVEETVLDLPFGKLIRFAKDIDTPQPRILVVA